MESSEIVLPMAIPILYVPCSSKHMKSSTSSIFPDPGKLKATQALVKMRYFCTLHSEGLQFQDTFLNLMSWIWSSVLSIFPCSCHRVDSKDFHCHIPHQTSHPHRSHCCDSPAGWHCAHSLGDFSSCVG